MSSTTNYILLTLSIFLVTGLTPSDAIFGTSIVDFFFQVINNLLSLTIDGWRFLGDYARYSRSEFPGSTPNNGDEYDFIVVGAGSAGATVAARLSEIEGAKVLLIEAGGNENLIMDIPILALYLQLNKLSNWAYLTEKNKNYCRGIVNQQCKVVKGKVMGGTSSLNFMIAVRGNKNDYDTWYNMTGDENWSYEGMLKSFKKMETFDAPLVNVDPAYHNFDGPQRIANPPHHTKLADAFVEAGREMGFPPVDYNGEKQTGFSYMQATQVNGERMSSNRAYLHPIRNRKNLVLSMNSLATKVITDKKTKTATGIEFIKNNKKIQVKAKKEIILSAGAIASPQLLMVSGIGPSEHLKNFNIDVLADLPVGENMMDHVAYGGLYFLVNTTDAIVVPEYLLSKKPSLHQFLTNRTGEFTITGGIEGLGYVNVDDPRADNLVPNIELMFGPVSFLSDYLIHQIFGINEKLFSHLYASDLYKHSWMIWPLLMKPKSRGKLLLKSSDMKVQPRLLANYFDDPEDVRILIKGIRMAIEVSKTQAMQKYGSKLVDRVVPECEYHEYDSDDYWECALKTITITLWHHSGTCKMGKKDDKSAVVDTRLKVLGINNLRVVDASIMPEIVTAHTNVPTIAIGEKGADIIKSDYGYSS